MTGKTEATELKPAGPNFWVNNYGDYLYSYAGTRMDDNELAEIWCKKLSWLH